ncbi:uncharacterized protein BO88DRAFT_423758 [Aspergillus vadensis CBS 113365]|uniref:Uncharacterized protein n=1 Tax=Aspergillus vadensis (strain CBS 113365 / IMI 142717 / IBT 24658) TaxID=1448311 RepID=A0A319BFT5_ASPVC|nr:hypothetical protein BO88DRAFT_423758 [Aspergillus vadensis CBS 113365]PYH70949.1 hypothetical protein BO88DRAFT_423758 [Aspergillus vadensis CBS 113365]
MAMADGRYGDIDSIFDSRDGDTRLVCFEGKKSASREKAKAPVECRHHLPTTSVTAASAVAGSLLGVCMVVPGNGHHFQFKPRRRELPKVGKSRSSERWGFRVRRGQNRVWLETVGPHWMGYS